MQLSVLERLNGVFQRRLSVNFGEDINVWAAVFVVLLFGVVNFLSSIGEPHHPVWDESYYMTAIARYEHGTTQFASHPPLALMLLTAGDLLVHPNRALDTTKVGADKQISEEKLPKGYTFGGIRLMSGVFAVLGGLAFFGLMLAITGSPARAVFFSTFYLFENAFIAHFRAAQLDAFQVCFEIVALLCLVLAMKRGPARMPWPELGFGAAIGMASMVKLNAIVLAPLGGMLLIWRLWQGWGGKERTTLLLRSLRDGVLMAVACIVVVFACFTAHIVVGTHPPDEKTTAGQKDASFLSPPYRAYLHHERGLSPAVVWAASWDYWRFMQSDLKGMPMTDPNGSQPLLWPLHFRAINYRWDSDGHHTSYVQLAGNVMSWWMALAALLATPVLLALAWWKPRGEARLLQEIIQLPRVGEMLQAAGTDLKRLKQVVEEKIRHPSRASTGETATIGLDSASWRRALMLMIFLQYLIYMGVHIYLGSMRVMYLYHYFLALVLSFVLVPLVLAEVCARWPKLKVRQDAIISVIVVAIVLSFAFYSPLSFHRPLSKGECELRNILQPIVKCQ